jgi:hypothetical protein
MKKEQKVNLPSPEKEEIQRKLETARANLLKAGAEMERLAALITH